MLGKREISLRSIGPNSPTARPFLFRSLDILSIAEVLRPSPPRQMLATPVNRVLCRLSPPLPAVLPVALSFSSLPQPGAPILPPPACSPARLCKLIAAQPDPLLAKSIFEVAGFSPSSPDSYPSLHVLILKLARARRFSLVDSLLRRLPSPSPGLFSSLIQLYADASLPDRALAVFHYMLRRTNCKPRSRHLNRVLSALAACPEHLPQALELLRSAGTIGVPLNVRSYNILIAAFSRRDRLSIAYDLFNNMIKRDFAPDVETYRILMQGLCRKSQVNTAVDLLEDMLNKGYVPDALSYTSLLNSLCRKKKLREAYKLLCKMKVKGCNPDIVHYNTVVLGFCREGRPLEACKVLEYMPDKGCLPNVVTYSTIVNGLCSRDMFEEGNRYMLEMLLKGMVPHFSVFDSLAKGFASVGKFEEACTVVLEMLNHGIAPHLDTWVAVLPGICEDDGEMYLDVVKKVVMEEEWRRSTRIVEAGRDLEEYMVRRFRPRGTGRF